MLWLEQRLGLYRRHRTALFLLRREEDSLKWNPKHIVDNLSFRFAKAEVECRAGSEQRRQPSPAPGADHPQNASVHVISTASPSQAALAEPGRVRKQLRQARLWDGSRLPTAFDRRIPSRLRREPGGDRTGGAFSVASDASPSRRCAQREHLRVFVQRKHGSPPLQGGHQARKGRSIYLRGKGFWAGE